MQLGSTLFLKHFFLWSTACFAREVKASVPVPSPRLRPEPEPPKRRGFFSRATQALSGSRRDTWALRASGPGGLCQARQCGLVIRLLLSEAQIYGSFGTSSPSTSGLYVQHCIAEIKSRSAKLGGSHAEKKWNRLLAAAVE